MLNYCDKLQVLRISRCLGLREFSIINRLKNLIVLEITRNPQIKNLNIHGLKNLKVLDCYNLINLEELKITNCKDLNLLILDNCHNIERMNTEEFKKYKKLKEIHFKCGLMEKERYNIFKTKMNELKKYNKYLNLEFMV